MDKITATKAELFDILLQMDSLLIQRNKLNEYKNQKLVELKKLEDEKNNPTD